MKRLLLYALMLLTLLPVIARADNLLERIATEILADRFGIDTSDILGVRRDTREDVWDLGPVFSMSRYGGGTASEVHRLRASGMGWGNIAKKIGMHPGTFNKLRKQGYFDRDPFWDDVFRRRYGVRQSDIEVIRRRGAKLEDVLAAVIIGKATGKSPSDIFNRYRNARDWNRTASYYKVDLDEWERYGRRVGWEGSSVPPPVSTGTGKSQGRGHGKGHGKGKSKGGG